MTYYCLILHAYILNPLISTPYLNVATTLLTINKQQTSSLLR